MKKYALPLAVSATLLLSTTALAAPKLSGSLVTELQTEQTVNSDDPIDDNNNNTFGRAELAPRLDLTKEFFIDGVAVFEPTQDVDPGDDNFFDNEGAFLEEIKLNYEHGPFAAWAGKFNPAFGKAWDWGRGVWGEDFAEDYEITEKVGLGGSTAMTRAA